MKKIVKYLRKPRWFTSDKLKAEYSIFQWSQLKNQEGYSLSLLGTINGLLPKLPGNPVLVTEVDEKTKKPTGKLYFKKKWW